MQLEKEELRQRKVEWVEGERPERIPCSWKVLSTWWRILLVKRL